MINIKKVCNGIYRNDGREGPSEIDFDGERLFRFMDRFYIRCATEELSFEEVVGLCRERASYPSTISHVNGVVRSIFQGVIALREPRRLLEIGGGNNPIMSACELESRGVSYVGADADPECVPGSNVFSGEDSRFLYGNECFDLAVAIFVLHFRFPSWQISELNRCMAPDGVFIGNVYRRDALSRKELADSFERVGFFVKKIPDPYSICANHEYWVIGKIEDVVESVTAQISRVADEHGSL